jgi:hypothetical protein
MKKVRFPIGELDFFSILPKGPQRKMRALIL